MTEPKKEKCEACCGSGYINFWTDDGHISMRTCRRCDGYGYIEAKPLTNEEWFCQLPTSEKAKVLSNATYSSVFNSDILVLGKEAEQKKWELWLKEKRNESV